MDSNNNGSDYDDSDNENDNNYVNGNDEVSNDGTCITYQSNVDYHGMG